MIAKVPHSKGASQFIQPLFIATGTVLALFLWQGNQGFSLWDEGYLWYGAQRVLAGDVPIRDFLSYDPGRYYWSAAFMRLWGDNGIMALRGAVAAFHAVGFFIGLLLLSHGPVKQHRLLWFLSAITLVVWSYPRHKLFDISLSLALIGILAFLVQQPSSRRYFLTGLVVGLVAVFGRNHGVYGATGSISIIAYLTLSSEHRHGLVKALAVWAAGVVIGYLPILLLLVMVPGFALSFWESIRFLFELKATNIPLPVPWPWRVPFGHLPTVEMVRGVLVGLFFIAIVVFGALGIVWVIRQKMQRKYVSPVLAASVFLTLPYAHYAYSRADVGHLALGIFPFLIGGFVLLSRLPAGTKWLSTVLLCGASLLIMLPLHPGWRCYVSQQCVEIDMRSDKLKIDPGTASDLTMLGKLAGQFAPGGRSFIATPFWPGAYAVLERKSPMWDVYALFPRSAAFQQVEIDRIKASNPGFAIIVDFPLDGREDLRFHNTHPMIDQYIRNHFEPLTGYTQKPSYHLYRSRHAAQ